MRANEFTTEVFSPEKAQPITWLTPKQAKSILPDGRSILVNFVPTRDGPIAVEFNVDGDYEMTGLGGVSTIFATVIEAVRQFVPRLGPSKSLFFTADEQSRAKMYDTISKRVAKQLGWHVVPYEEMIADKKYQTPLSYGDYLFAIEPGHAPEHRQQAQKPQHSEFMTIYHVVAMDNPKLPAIRLKAKNSSEAEDWVHKTVPEFAKEHPLSLLARKVPPQDREIKDMGTVPPKPKHQPIEQDPNSLGAKLRAKLMDPQHS